MKIGFLTEGGKGIGMGHISRCSALVDGFIELGHTVKMNIRGDIHTIQNLESYNYEIIEWFDEEKLNKTIQAFDTIIVDSYLASEELLEQIAKEAKNPVFLIDSKLKYHPEGIVFFPSVYAHEFSHNFSKKTELISGRNFLLFNKNMWQLPDYKVKKDTRQIGISLGGYLNEETGLQVTNAIRSVFPKVQINIFGNIDLNEIQDTNINDHGFLPKTRYIQMLFENDILIVNGGQSLNEALLVGIPSISVTIADNQIKNTKAWENQGLAININPNSENLEKGLTKALKKYTNYDYRKELSLKSKEIMPVSGAVNAAQKIIEIIKNR